MRNFAKDIVCCRQGLDLGLYSAMSVSLLLLFRCSGLGSRRARGSKERYFNWTILTTYKLFRANSHLAVIFVSFVSCLIRIVTQMLVSKVTNLFPPTDKQ